MQSTVVALGREYTVETHITEKNTIPYTLVGKRGARYHVVRNFHKPKYLFTNIHNKTQWFEELEIGVLKPVYSIR